MINIATSVEALLKRFAFVQSFLFVTYFFFLLLCLLLLSHFFFFLFTARQAIECSLFAWANVCSVWRQIKDIMIYYVMMHFRCFIFLRSRYYLLCLKGTYCKMNKCSFTKWNKKCIRTCRIFFSIFFPFFSAYFFCLFLSHFYTALLSLMLNINCFLFRVRMAYIGKIFYSKKNIRKAKNKILLFSCHTWKWWWWWKWSRLYTKIWQNIFFGSTQSDLMFMKICIFNESL